MNSKFNILLVLVLIVTSFVIEGKKVNEAPDKNSAFTKEHSRTKLSGVTRQEKEMHTHPSLSPTGDSKPEFKPERRKLF